MAALAGAGVLLPIAAADDVPQGPPAALPGAAARLPGAAAAAALGAEAGGRPSRRPSSRRLTCRPAASALGASGAGRRRRQPPDPSAAGFLLPAAGRRGRRRGRLSPGRRRRGSSGSASGWCRWPGSADPLVPLDPRPEPVDAAALLVGADAEFLVSPRVVRPVDVRHPPAGRPRSPPVSSSFEPGQQTAIAAHELLHVSRRDWVRTLGDEAAAVGALVPPGAVVARRADPPEHRTTRRPRGRAPGGRPETLSRSPAEAGRGRPDAHAPARVAVPETRPPRSAGGAARAGGVHVARAPRFVVRARARPSCAAGGWAVVQAFPLTAAARPAVLPVGAGRRRLHAGAATPPPRRRHLRRPRRRRPSRLSAATVPAPGALPAAGGTLRSCRGRSRSALEDAGDFARAREGLSSS
ncbi:MAG: hypothetical protein MZV64_43360 [Ignavibacteriales bacterium]|nr:hypothetical protein [Ignavibacteriales bacterium]